MAILEADQKKTEVAVTSTQPSDCVKAYCSVSSSEPCSSTSGKSFKIFNLFKTIKDFHFCMPSGWNDIDIGIFVHVCKQNFPILKKSDEIIKWREIANSGAKISHNKTLFTINSCMDLAQTIKGYICHNEISLRNNETFRNFHRDIADLLPLFPEPNSYPSMSSPYQSHLNFLKKVYKTESVRKTIQYCIEDNLEEIQAGTGVVWHEIECDLEQLIGVKIDLAQILSSFKETVIFDTMNAKDPPVRQLLFGRVLNVFIDNFHEVFNYLAPNWATTDDLFYKEYHEIPELFGDWIEESKSKRIPHIYAILPQLELIVRKRTDEGLPQIGWIDEEPFGEAQRRMMQRGPKGKQQRRLKEGGPSGVQQKRLREGEQQRRWGKGGVSGEQLRKLSMGQSESSGVINYKASSSSDSGCSSSSANIDSKITSVVTSCTTDFKNESECSSSGSEIQNNNKREKVSSKQRINGVKSDDDDVVQSSPKVPRLRQRGLRNTRRPTRILPSREVKNKKSSSRSKNRNKPQTEAYVSPDSPESSFRGFEEVDVHSDVHPVERNVKILRSYIMKRTVTKTVANPDTTTQDDSDSGLSNSRVSSNTADEEQSPRSSHELGNRPTRVSRPVFIPPDTTMQPIVKLEQLRKFDLQALNGRPGSGLPRFASEQNTPAESAGLGRNIVATAYNTLADSVMTDAEPSSAPESQRNYGQHPSRLRLNQREVRISDSSESDEIIARYLPRRMARDSTSGDPQPSENVSFDIRHPPITRPNIAVSNIQHNQTSEQRIQLPNFPQSETSLSMPQYDRNNFIAPSTSSQPRAESTVAVIDSRNRECQGLALHPAYNSNFALDVYNRRPLWLDSFMEENRKQQAQKLIYFQKMQEDILAIESKKLYLMEKILDKFQ